MGDDENSVTKMRYPSRRREKTLKFGKYAAKEGEDTENIFTSDDHEELPGESSLESSNNNSSSSEDEEEISEKKFRRGRRNRATKDNKETTQRKFSRTNKCNDSMKEPRTSDLMVHSDEGDATHGRRRSRRSTLSTHASSGLSSTEVESDNYKDEKPTKKSCQTTNDDFTRKGEEDQSVEPSCTAASASEAEEYSSDGEEDEDDPPRIQRILATRTETLKVWDKICASMNTTEIDTGSMWYQKHEGKADALEQRFLVKWADQSYLHCSWETAKDLNDQVDNAKTFLATFFRKSEDGILFTPEERCDGDYFDPAFTEIDRILEVEWPSEVEETKRALMSEDEATSESLRIVVSKENPDYGKEGRLGRRFYIKWMNQPYGEATYEFERDLILNCVEYKEPLKRFLRRKDKPSKSLLQTLMKDADAAHRKLYKTFCAQSSISAEKRQEHVEDYQKYLCKKVFKNGGQLRHYQAEGVSWIIANYINKKSCILADEMGLGKTLQCAAAIDIIQTQRLTSCCLVIAPLSTIPHWLREFQSWTELNVIVYHGGAKDRKNIREWEMAYEADRSKNTGAGFLRRCTRGKRGKDDSQWMAQVVITTPEMLVTEDALELSAITWEVLIVDEAHRLKNHNSKLASTVRDKRFTFNHRILCTGTPIQNDMKELWTLLNFIDSDCFKNMDEFLDKYGDMKSKEAVDELHEMLRPYILRRLKEDAEKNMPSKEETIIEVELTVTQKKYYRALYEKNVTFLKRGKTKAIDGPSLNNLAMQLRKCCNHVCLLNGIEEELQKQHTTMNDADFLVKGSGKFVLLDKLLPRLNGEGHRVLIFSQFKMVLDVLEDYLRAKEMSFCRIDGSITGTKRQAAIDSFQSNKENAPFIMMLSTRAGGVGINLTAADTVIIFDSDWNPQNDLQAQARCHRIGQKRVVKVYRLLSARTYEMQMFNLSSMKMGLDQAVLKGFESSSEGRLSKEEIEKLLKHGAYAMLKEDKDGKAEIMSNEFVDQDLDSILERRTRTIVHGSEVEGGKAGSTFSKASFKVANLPCNDETVGDVDIDDPDFWKKVLGESFKEAEIEDLDRKQRRRGTKNYFEGDKLEFEEHDDSLARKKPKVGIVGRDPNAKDGDYNFESDVSSDCEDNTMAASIPITGDDDSVVAFKPNASPSTNTYPVKNGHGFGHVSMNTLNGYSSQDRPHPGSLLNQHYPGCVLNQLPNVQMNPFYQLQATSSPQCHSGYNGEGMHDFFHHVRPSFGFLLNQHYPGCATPTWPTVQMNPSYHPLGPSVSLINSGHKGPGEGEKAHTPSVQTASPYFLRFDL